MITMKKFFSRVGLVGLALVAVTAAGAVLEWTRNVPEDNVQFYVLEHRATTTSAWTHVEVPASTNRVSIPESVYGRWFRMAAVNSFGQSDWTTPVKLPEKVTGFKWVLEITP